MEQRPEQNSYLYQFIKSLACKFKRGLLVFRSTFRKRTPDREKIFIIIPSVCQFSPDNKTVAYVYKHNLYTEQINSTIIAQLTNDGTNRIINGTFDWAYEEELSIRDGFSWNDDGTKIAFWHTDARATKNYLMIDNTDSIYPFIKPVEYPVAGEKPSPVKIGVVNIASKRIVWMEIPGDPANNYIPRMDWSGNNEVMAVQLNRLQNQAKFYLCNASTGNTTMI